MNSTHGRNSPSFLFKSFIFVLCLSVISFSYAGKNRRTSAATNYQQINSETSSYRTYSKVIGGLIITVGLCLGAGFIINKLLKQNLTKVTPTTCSNKLIYDSKDCNDYRHNWYNVADQACMLNPPLCLPNSTDRLSHDNLTSDNDTYCNLPIRTWQKYIANKYHESCVITGSDSIICSIRQVQDDIDETGLSCSEKGRLAIINTGNHTNVNTEKFPGEADVARACIKNEWGKYAKYTYSQFGPIKNYSHIDQQYAKKYESFKVHLTDLVAYIHDNPVFDASKTSFNQCVNLSRKIPDVALDKHDPHLHGVNINLNQHTGKFLNCLVAHITSREYTYKVNLACTELKKLIDNTPSQLIKVFIGDSHCEIPSENRQLTVTEVMRSVTNMAYNQKLNSVVSALFLDADKINAPPPFVENKNHSELNNTNNHTDDRLYTFNYTIMSPARNPNFFKDMKPEELTEYLSRFINRVHELRKHPENLNLIESLQESKMILPADIRSIIPDYIAKSNITSEQLLKISEEKFKDDLKLQSDRMIKSLVDACVKDFEEKTTQKTPEKILEIQRQLSNLEPRNVGKSFFFSENNPKMQIQGNISSTQGNETVSSHDKNEIDPFCLSFIKSQVPPHDQSRTDKPTTLNSEASSNYSNAALALISVLTSIITVEGQQSPLGSSVQQKPFTSETKDSCSENKHFPESTMIKSYQLTNLVLANESISIIQLRAQKAGNDELPEPEPPLHSIKMSIRDIFMTFDCHADELLNLLHRHSTMFVAKLSTSVVKKKPRRFVGKLDNMPFSQILDYIDDDTIKEHAEFDDEQAAIMISEVIYDFMKKYKGIPLSKVLSGQSDCEILKKLEPFLAKECWTPEEFKLSRVFVDIDFPVVFCKTHNFVSKETADFDNDTPNETDNFDNKLPGIIVMPTTIKSKTLLEVFTKTFYLSSNAVMPNGLMLECNIHLPLSSIINLLHEIFPEEMREMRHKFLVYDTNMSEHLLRKYLKNCDQRLKNIVWDLVSDKQIMNPYYGNGLLHNTSALAYAKKEWGNPDGYRVQFCFTPVSLVNMNHETKSPEYINKRLSNKQTNIFERVFKSYNEEQVKMDPYCYRECTFMSLIWDQESFPEGQIQRNVRELLQTLECEKTCINDIYHCLMEKSKLIMAKYQ